MWGGIISWGLCMNGRIYTLDALGHSRQSTTVNIIKRYEHCPNEQRDLNPTGDAAIEETAIERITNCMGVL